MPTRGNTISMLCLRLVETAGVVSEVKIKLVFVGENIIIKYS
jgi:hypothetical protein